MIIRAIERNKLFCFGLSYLHHISGDKITP